MYIFALARLTLLDIPEEYGGPVTPQNVIIAEKCNINEKCNKNRRKM